MANKAVTDWSKAISDSFDAHRKLDGKLSPSKNQMKYVADLARSIDKKAQLMDYASEMGHQGLLDFEVAQKIMNTQKEIMKKDIKLLLTYLEDDE